MGPIWGGAYHPPTKIYIMICMHENYVYYGGDEVTYSINTVHSIYEKGIRPSPKGGKGVRRCVTEPNAPKGTRRTPNPEK